MNEERKKILEKVNELIDKRKSELLKKFPTIHELEDGFVVRFFTLWDDYNENNSVKFKKISCENDEEIAYFFYIPKDVFFEIKKKFYVGTITCLTGGLELEINGKTRYLESYNRINLKTNELMGKALEDTYVSTTNLV